MTLLRRLIALSLTLVAVLFSTSTAGAATPPVDGYVSGYAYDGSHHPAPPAHTASERGPPALHNYTNPAYGAVGHRPHGVSARLNGPTTLSITTYAYPERFVRGAGATATTSRDVVLADGDLLPVPAGQVAAKNGDELVDVWRVVGPDEAAQIAKTKTYQVQPGGEGKYFFPTREQAENLGQMYTKAGWGGQQTLTRGQVPRSVVGRAEPVNAGTEGPGLFIRSPDVPSICNVSCVGPVG